MDGRQILERAAASVGVLGLVAVLPFYVSSGLAAPLWAIILLLLLWAALAVCAVRWFTRRPWVVLVLPVVAVVVWLLALTLGEQLLGWQA
ncbi:hypothetical protein [Knoellia aerolata]|uniref:DUF4175 domain-containing protein n=1 Tax=Knoellia aerolata DSM 18566 TaxID=1385519 RepID=A0A0A0K459_9MICO|nr:hypothetical protein [Knoellia aerolata]KGN42576.1 hypothetical protein N801_15410 [Knoellia aerolata DSM 18566]